MTNKYLEKIAAKMKVLEAVRAGNEIYHLGKKRRKERAKAKVTKPSVRKFSRANVKK